MSFVIKTNLLQLTDVLIRDMGILVPNSGGTVTLSDIRDLETARLSRDLATLTTDNAFGANSSTLIISDDSRDIPQSFAIEEIREASLEDTLHRNTLMQLASSGILQGGVITRNATPSRFDVSDGFGRIVNSYSNPREPEYYLVNWTGKTFIAVTNLATSDFTYVLVDLNGNIVQQTSAPTPDQTRDYIVLGALVHPSRAIISSVSNNQVLGYSTEQNFVDFTSSFGPFNVDGNIISANGSNLYINRSSGKIFKYGSNYSNSTKSPNILNTNPATQASFTRLYRNGSGGTSYSAPTFSIDPNNYDDGSGTLAAVTSGNWTVQFVFFFAETSAIQVAYGQTQYVDKLTAESRINDPFEVASQLTNAIFRGWIVVQQGATNLSDTATATFIAAGKFGLISSLSSSSSGEINTASNIGNRGIGWYVQKLGVDLQFKNIYAASNKVSLTDTPAQHSIDVDVIPANIDHSLLGNVIGGETGYHYHLSTIEYNWIHANPTGVRGFTGSQGHTGVQGYTGIDGVTGIDGITGVQGDTGVIGETGLEGIQGLVGATGSMGITGSRGMTGVIGYTGAMGVTGSRGVTGVIGLTGINGDTGAIGVTGVQGETGAQGQTGSQGHTGALGVTGFQGATGIVGSQGTTGIIGLGIASGGVTGQFLIKASNVDYATAWHTMTSGDVGADPVGSANALKPRIANALSSGLLTGGLLSINADPTLFDIAAGVGLVVDNTNNNPTYSVVSWADQLGVPTPYLATDDTTYIAIDSTGSIIMQPEFFNNEDLCDLISLGWVDHTNRTTITFHASEPYLISNVGVQLHTFFEALGAFNISGNEYYANPNSLILAKTAGTTFDNGANYVSSIKSPNVLDSPGETGAAFQYYYRTAPGVWFNAGPTTSTVDPNNYDVGVGLTGVPTGKFTIQTVSFYAPNTYTDIAYGQVLYDTLEDAGAAVNIPVETNPYNSYDTFRAWLVVQQGVTGLDSATQCQIINTGKFGTLSGRSGGGGSGEANTASNVGLQGIGLFDVKSGVDLHFKNINVGSNKLSVSNNIPEKTVDLDVIPSNIDHDTLGNFRGGESGYRYHLSTIEYDWIHANPTGVRGYTGAQGHTGASGLTGIVGVTGFQGVTGLIGSTGLLGATGFIGVTGIIGATGLIGLTGYQGHTGSQGLTGGAGSEGVIGVVVDGAGSAITTGSKGFRVINGTWTITDWTLLGKETGSCVVDVRKGTYDTYPGTTGIAGSEKPTLTNQIKNQNTTLSSWYKTLNDGDVVEFIVDSASVVTKIILSISVSKE